MTTEAALYKKLGCFPSVPILELNEKEINLKESYILDKREVSLKETYQKYHLRTIPESCYKVAYVASQHQQANFVI